MLLDYHDLLQPARTYSGGAGGDDPAPKLVVRRRYGESCLAVDYSSWIAVHAVSDVADASTSISSILEPFLPATNTDTAARSRRRRRIEEEELLLLDVI